jgi:hypothetical protein
MRRMKKQNSHSQLKRSGTLKVALPFAVFRTYPILINLVLSHYSKVVLEPTHPLVFFTDPA